MEIKEITDIIQDIERQIEYVLNPGTPEAPELRQLRDAAYGALKTAGLPGPKDEEYKYAYFGKVLAGQFAGVNPGGIPSEESISLAMLNIWDNEDVNLLVLINGHYIPHLSSWTEDSGAAIISSLSDQWSKQPQTVIEYFGRISDYRNDPYVAWNTAMWTGGLFMHLSDKTVLKKPVVIHHIVDSKDTPVLCFPRSLYVAGKQAHANIIEVYEQIGDNSSFTNSVTECVAYGGAEINLYKFQQRSSKAYDVDHTRISQYGRGVFNAYTFSFDGAVVRNNLQIAMEEEHCEAHLYGLYLLRGKTLVDNHTVVDHKKANCFSNELYKGVMDEYATGVFNGKIFVRPSAQKTNAFQSNKNLVLTDTASVNTKPQLEIWADDVKCSHGCTTGQLDPEQLFYLRSRGLSEESAKGMLLQAFAHDVLEKVGVNFLRQRLEKIIHERLHD